MLATSYENCIKSIKITMININKEIFKKALLAGIFSAFTIGVLTVLTYKSALGLFIAGSFGSSMVLLFGFPESPFAQPKNVFFGHLVTAIVGVIFVAFIPLPMFINIALAVGVGIFLMILLNVVHPPAGGNPIVVIIGSVSYDYLLSPIIFGCIIIISLAILINKFLLKKNYPLK
jgi:CBS-domain-containing membrane protein